MATKLYLIRHGATEGALEKRYKGSIDVPLSDEGKKQAAQAGELLQRLSPPGAPDRRPPAVYCSSLSRAVDTAAIIAAPYGITPIVVPGLQERNFGRWEGLTFAEVRKQYPAEFSSWIDNPLDFSPPGGENTHEVARRAQGAMEKILARHQEDQLIVVAHGGVNRVLLCLFLGMPLENIFRIEQDFAAINIVELYNNYPRFPVVRAMNLIAEGTYG